MKASQLFQVGIATVYRWIKRKKQRGNVEPLRKKSSYKKIDDQKLIAYVEQNPDHFLSEIAKHFGLTLQAIFYALKGSRSQEKKTTFYKKRNAEAREDFIKKIEAISPEKRIYLNQSGINQYLHR